MKKLKFKQGDWCFYKFKLVQILDVVENRITSVSDGSIISDGYDLSSECYPLDMKVKQISDTVNSWYNDFHREGNNAINYPDLTRELVRRWVEMCEFRDDDKKKC